MDGPLWKEAQDFCASSEVPLTSVSKDSESINFTIGPEALSFTISLQGSQFFVETEELTDEWLDEASDDISENMPLVNVLQACVKAFRNHPEKKEDKDEASDSNDGEFDAEEEPEVHHKRSRSPEEEEVDTSSFQVGGYERAAVMQIAKELKAVRNTPDETRGYTAGPLGDNLGHWEVKLTRIPKEEQIWADLQKMNMDCITFRIVFPPNYPFAPPYIRVLRPRFQFRTGHVTLGGSICTELLSNQGWNPMYRLEQILVDVMALMLDGGAKIDLEATRRQGDYTEAEAKEAFRRMLQTHGWTHWKQ